MRKQQVNWERDCEFWREKICKSTGPCPDEEALELLDILQSGEAAFFCESPRAASLEEAVRMVRQAALEMAPEPGWVVLAVMMRFNMGMEWGFEEAEEIIGAFQQSFPENETTDVYWSIDCCDRGVHFVLATAEGKKEPREEIDIAAEMAFKAGYITANMLMRRFRFGYTRTAALLKRMEQAGLVSSYEPISPRRLLMTPEQWKAARGGSK